MGGPTAEGSDDFRGVRRLAGAEQVLTEAENELGTAIVPDSLSATSHQ